MKKLPPAVLYRRLPARWIDFTIFAVAFVATWPLSAPAQPQPQRLNNLTALLLEAAPTGVGETFSFTRPRDGWIFISANYKGQGTVRIILDKANDPVIVHDADGGIPSVVHPSVGPHFLNF